MAATRMEITAGDAMKFFKGAKIAVQDAKVVKVKGEDGKTREGFDVKNAELAERHIIGAADYGDRVAIVTLDGKRYEAKK